MRQRCEICGKKSYSNRCFKHKKREIDVDEIEKMQNFFLSIWNKRPHKSEVSGEKLFPPPSSAYFHHILLKEKHKEACFDEENIVLLTLNEHANVHLDANRYEEVNKRREKLLTKYGINQ